MYDYAYAKQPKDKNGALFMQKQAKDQNINVSGEKNMSELTEVIKCKT